jgi:hypothetical protein
MAGVEERYSLKFKIKKVNPLLRKRRSDRLQDLDVPLKFNFINGGIDTLSE